MTKTHLPLGNLSALGFSIMFLSACGTQGLNFDKANKRKQGAESQDSTQGRGSLALTLPAQTAAFADVAHVEIYIRKADCSPTQNRCTTQARLWTSADLNRTVAYKPGEKVSLGDISTGSIELKINLLNKDKKSLYEGLGSTQVETAKTANVEIYVSPTQGSGSVEITIKPFPPERPKCGGDSGPPGGYLPILSSDPKVQEAAQFALKVIKPAGDYKLTFVSNSCYQIVAGTNYAFTMGMASPPYAESYDVIVFRGLDGAMTLTQKSNGIANLPARVN